MAGERLREALASFRRRYRAASRRERSGLLDELCQLTGYHRKYAIRLLNTREETTHRPRQVDRRLAPSKRCRKRRLYGRTKPRSFLRDQVPIRAEALQGTPRGYTEVDLVSHTGPSARGEFAYSLNLNRPAQLLVREPCPAPTRPRGRPGRTQGHPGRTPLSLRSPAW